MQQVKETNFDEVKKVALNLLYISPTIDDEIIFIVHHPFFNTNPFTFVDKDHNLKAYDLLNFDSFIDACRVIKDKIEKANKLSDITMLFNTHSLMVFFKYCNEYLNMQDYSELLGEIWVNTENPNQDINCPISLIVKWFKKADKAILMNQEDYEYYCNLPEEFDVYRGVSVGRNPNGISWTNNLETARWFAHRFDTKKQSGYILKAHVHKKDVLAYFNTRNEQEIVINPKLQFIKEV